MKTLCYILIVLFLPLSSALDAQVDNGAIVITQAGDNKEYNLDGKLLYYCTANEDYIPTASFSEFVFLENNYFQYRSKKKLPYNWVVLKLKNNTSEAQTFHFIVDNPLLGSIECFRLEKDGYIKLYTTGDQYPFNTRPIRYQTFAFPMELSADGSATYAFRMNNGGKSFYMSMYLYHPDVYEELNFKNSLINTSFLGFIIFGVAINLLLFFFVKDTSFLALALINLGYFSIRFTATGVGFQYLYPEFPYLHNALCHLSSYFMSFSILLFARFYFRFDVLPKWLNKSLLYLALLVLLVAQIIWLDENMYLSNLIVMPVLNICSAIMLFVAIWSAIKKDRIARIFLVWGLCWLVVLLLFQLPYTRDKFGGNSIGDIFTIILTGLSFLLLTAAKFDRFRLLKEEKESALARSVDYLKNLGDYKEQVNQMLNRVIDDKTKELHMKQVEISHAMLNGEEAERKRISMELHDGLGSVLSIMKMNFTNMAANSSGLDDTTNKMYKNTLELLDKSHDELRSIAGNLMSPVLERYGLKDAIKNLIEKSNSEKLVIDFHFTGLEKRLAPETEIAIYRIVQELLQNIIKHASATKATINITDENSSILVLVEDDGTGIKSNQKNGGMGLNNIKNRIQMLDGIFTIDSSEKNGTTVIVEIPKINN